MAAAWAVLIVFVMPFIVLLPLKFLEVYLLVHRQWIAAILVLVLAKLLGLGVTAFIFDVTKPKLLRMAWFRWLYELMLSWLERAHALIDPIKAPHHGAGSACSRRSAPGARCACCARIRRRAQAQPAE